MRVLDGERSLVRIIAGEERRGHRPLARALLERLRAEGFASGALVTVERVRVLKYAARASANRSNPGGA